MTTGSELAVRPDEELSVSELYSGRRLSLTEMVRARAELKQFIATQMVKGTDYGYLPNTRQEDIASGKAKPFIRKEGTTKVCQIFNVTPRLRCLTESIDWDHGRVMYRYACDLVSRATGTVVVEGAVGSCSNREVKYRYRWAWGSDLDRDGVSKEARGALKQRDIRTVRGPSKQYRVENEDWEDLVNTVDKMAQKRAVTAAVTMLYSVADFFTQDLEDLGDQTRQMVVDAEAEEVTTPPPTRKVKQTAEPAPPPEPDDSDLDLLSDPNGGAPSEVAPTTEGHLGPGRLRDELLRLAGAVGAVMASASGKPDSVAVSEALAPVAGLKAGIYRSGDLTIEEASKLCAAYLKMTRPKAPR